MAELKKDKKPFAEFNLDKEYESLGINTKDLKADKVHAFVPVEFSLYTTGGDGVKVNVTKFEPVRNIKEVRKFFEILDAARVGEGGKTLRIPLETMKELFKMTESSRRTLEMMHLDAGSLRGFVKLPEKDLSTFEKILASAGLGKKKPVDEKTKLYLDNLEDLKKINWQNKTEVFFEKKRPGQHLSKKTQNDKTERKDELEELPYRDIRSQTEKEVAKEEVILEIKGVPNFVARGDRGTIEAAKDKLKGNGIDASSFQESTILKPAAQAGKTNSVPDKPKEVGKIPGTRQSRSRTKDLGRGRGGL